MISLFWKHRLAIHLCTVWSAISQNPGAVKSIVCLASSQLEAILLQEEGIQGMSRNLKSNAVWRMDKKKKKEKENCDSHYFPDVTEVHCAEYSNFLSGLFCGGSTLVKYSCENLPHIVDIYIQCDNHFIPTFPERVRRWLRLWLGHMLEINTMLMQ